MDNGDSKVSYLPVNKVTNSIGEILYEVDSSNFKAINTYWSSPGRLAALFIGFLPCKNADYCASETEIE